jgi:hypothetical protein
VKARRRQAQEAVARQNGAAVNAPAAFDDTDTEAGQVVLPRLIKAGQLGRFPANEGAAGLLAAGGDPGDHLFRDPDVQGAGCEIIKKEEWFCATYNQVVDVHRD